MSTDTEKRIRFEAIAGEVFEPLQRYLRRRVNHTDAQDVLSDVLMTVWRRIDDVPTEQALPWSYGVARKALANHNRARSRRLRLVARLELERQPSFETGPGEGGPDHELDVALSTLSGGDREVLRLWAWEQLEPREIGPVLGISVNAATLRLSRARKKLAIELRGQDAEAGGHERVEGTQERIDD
jgi:RNA polymerase sigma-70 factor (ECF subfamily)